MKKIILLTLVLLGGCKNVSVEKFSDVPDDDALNFMIVNDMGRQGYYDHKTIAEEMGAFADRADAEFVLAAGDVHHNLGVQSVSDPLWMTNFELVYSHPELQIEWFPIEGNHEYHGNAEALVDYSDVSRRWVMPARYYTFAREVDDNTSLRVLMLDTPPLIDKYRNDADYTDAGAQDMDLQLRWIDSVLTASTEKWKVVVGHHPIYAGTDKNDKERTDMQQRLDPILRRHNVDYYIAGHIHNFQHLRTEGSGIDYVVNSSGSASRDIVSVEGQLYTSPLSGFSVMSATADSLNLHMIDAQGQLLHTVRRGK